MKLLKDGKSELDVSHLSNGDINKLVKSLGSVNAEVWVEGEERTSALKGTFGTMTHIKCYTDKHPAKNYANDTYVLLEIEPTMKLSIARNSEPKAAEVYVGGIAFTKFAEKLVGDCSLMWNGIRLRFDSAEDMEKFKCLKNS